MDLRVPPDPNRGQRTELNRALPNSNPSTKEVQMFNLALTITCVIAALTVLILVANLAETLEN